MKKILCTLLSGALLCGCLAAPAAAAKVDESLVDPWAAELVNRAAEKKLMPECLEGLSLKENITRAQFAAVCVRLFEAMSKETAELPATNPFQDTDDPDVLKAYELGVVSGLAPGFFGGDELMTREQAAVMLTSVYKAQRIRSKGAYYLMWLISQYGEYGGSSSSGSSGDSSTENSQVLDNYGLIPHAANNVVEGIYKKLYGELDTSNAVFFADHASISSWARDSVYFMERNGVINGVGNNIFQPQSQTQAQAALIMAVNMLEKI